MTTPPTTLKEKVEDFEKPEYPVDPRADALAARLRMADPQMDSKTAKKIAKTLLSPAARWEMKQPAAEPEQASKHVDFTA